MGISHLRSVNLFSTLQETIVSKLWKPRLYKGKQNIFWLPDFLPLQFRFKASAIFATEPQDCLLFIGRDYRTIGSFFHIPSAFYGHSHWYFTTSIINPRTRVDTTFNPLPVFTPTTLFYTGSDLSGRLSLTAPASRLYQTLRHLDRDTKPNQVVLPSV